MPIKALPDVILAAASAELRRHLSKAKGDEKGAFQPGVQYWQNAYVKGIREAKLFDINTISEWMMVSTKNSREAFFQILDFPCCTPPYPFTYLEWEQDTLGYVTADGSVARRDEVSGRSITSAYCIYGETDYNEGGMIHASLFETQTASALDGRGHIIPLPRTTYFLGSLYLHLNANGSVRGHLDEDGVTVPDVEVEYGDHFISWLEGDSEEVKSSYLRILGENIGVTMLALSLLNCTNVKAVEVDPRSRMTRQQIRAQERDKRPFLTYNIIEVKPFGSYRKYASEKPGEGRIRRLHQVKGHFAEYGEEYGHGKLFGRYEGCFYIPPHTRGDMDNGVVASQYKLMPPKEEIRV